jgi:hypothetical protein
LFVSCRRVWAVSFFFGKIRIPQVNLIDREKRIWTHKFSICRFSIAQAPFFVARQIPLFWKHSIALENSQH